MFLYLFLENITASVGDIFDGTFFKMISNTLNQAYLALGQHHGGLTTTAEAFCGINEEQEGEVMH